MVSLLNKMDIAYLARASFCDAANIRKAKKYIKRALETQMQGAGYSLVELLSPCPTNWAMEPVKAAKYIKDTIMPVFPVGEFIGKEDASL